MPNQITLYGKIGEFAQGFLDGSPWVIPANINTGKYNVSVSVTPNHPTELLYKSYPKITPTKLHKLLEQFESTFDIPKDFLGIIEVTSTLPIGKGFGSSSCDMSALALALAKAHNVSLHPTILFEKLCLIERSDTVWMVNTLTKNHVLTGQYEIIGDMPKFVVIAWDDEPHKMVDTQDASSIDSKRASHESEYTEILELIYSLQACKIQIASTMSSEINNKYLPKSSFSWAKNVASEYDYGVISCHSGTWIGWLILPDTLPEQLEKLRQIVKSKGSEPRLFKTGNWDHPDVEKAFNKLTIQRPIIQTYSAFSTYDNNIAYGKQPSQNLN